MNDRLSPDERQRLDSLFDRAADLPLSEHASFVERECGSAGPLRTELERLLLGLAGEDRLGRVQVAAPLEAGTQIGPYKLLERIGEGGMGEVYAAEQREPVVRRVALKVIKPGMDSVQVVARFEAERQALARMSHPNIAQVFDGGASADGRPYFVMEYVAGESITEYCDRRKLSTRERVELFLEVCDGVQHAHQKGIVHRDLKPSNLMVTQDGGRVTPKVIDFGVARATTGRLAEHTLHTLVGQVVGTLDYMSPEQADPTGVDIDTRSDIYSLGVVLYQLVSGLLPFERALSVGVPFSALQRAIREKDAPTPSTRLRRETGTAASIAPLHGTDGRSLVRQLHGDLDWICLKALEKEPERRYASASAMADDLRRHLDHQPVLAGRPGALYRARKYVRRNRIAVSAAVLVAGAVFAGTVGIAAGKLEARSSERFAQAAMDAYDLPKIVRRAEGLWPPHPERIEDMREWVEDAQELTGRLERHAARRLVLLGGARSDGEVEAGRSRFRTLAEESELDLLDRALEVGTWLEANLLAENVTVEGMGWSVPDRIAFAERSESAPSAGGEYEMEWEGALDRMPYALAAMDGDRRKDDAVYFGLELRPQLGLLPLGPDPDSGLWEFVHLQTGEAPERGGDGDGPLIMTEDSGLVFVLIPGGVYAMGNQAEFEVELSPYFLAKYEMTQGQWMRLTGSNPSAYGPHHWDAAWGERGTLLHPVEQVSWEDCHLWLGRAGLSLPSEAQWEVGARAGTTTQFAFGPKRIHLVGADGVGFVNLRDECFKRADLEFWGRYEDGYDDQAVVHWPVDSHLANGFGLHDMHGNVWEWCLDEYGDLGDLLSEDEAVKDPVRIGTNDHRYIYRGGSFRHHAGFASSNNRSFDPPSFFGSGRGVRPARAIVD